MKAMSYTRYSPFEAVELMYHCSFCGVLPGEWCLTRSGVASQFLHAPRYYLAVEHIRLQARRHGEPDT